MVHQAEIAKQNKRRELQKITSTLTTSVSNTKNEWNFLNSGDFLRTFLETLNCQARPSGYLYGYYKINKRPFGAMGEGSGHEGSNGRTKGSLQAVARALPRT